MTPRRWEGGEAAGRRGGRYLIPGGAGGGQHLRRDCSFCILGTYSPEGGTMSADALRLGFLGAGKMATALARGWIDAGLTEPGRVLASDPVPAAREAFAAATG